MKIALTGSGGFLGSRIMEYYRDREFGEQGKASFIPLRHQETALTEENAVDAFFRREQPDVLIHCAAISDTGACQNDPEMSRAVNVEAPRVLAGACARYGTKLLFCSSDQIYFEEGDVFRREHFHSEEEMSHPKGIYGQQKLQAEKEILEVCPDAVALRLSWMYDWESRPGEHGTLVSTILENVRAGRTFSYPVHDYRSITNVWEVVRNLGPASMLPGGVYNFGSQNEGSTYEIALEILKLISADTTLLQKNTESFCGCPRNLRMDTEKIKKYGIHFLPTLKGLAQEAP